MRLPPDKGDIGVGVRRMNARLRCSYCRSFMRRGPGAPTKQATRDHILPRCEGRLPPDVRNTRPACLRCNTLRANLGHCPAVLATVLDLARFANGNAVAVARRLGLLTDGGPRAAAVDQLGGCAPEGSASALSVVSDVSSLAYAAGARASAADFRGS